MRAALRRGAVVYKNEVDRRIPRDSGQLAASARITTRYQRGRVSASVKVGNFVAWYAHLVEFGTRPHEIRTEGRNAMQFGQTVTRVVNHPGTGARPFMRPAADAGFAEAIREVRLMVRKRLTKQGLAVPPPLPQDPTS